jgi:hypothetical protein
MLLCRYRNHTSSAAAVGNLIPAAEVRDRDDGCEAVEQLDARHLEVGRHGSVFELLAREPGARRPRRCGSAARV